MGEFRFIGVPALQAKAMAALTFGVTQAAEDLVNQAQAATPVDTGTLKASIHVDSVQSDGTSVTARVATGGEASEYAIFQHEGTSRGVPATKFLEGPLLANAAVYRAAIAAAGQQAF